MPDTRIAFFYFFPRHHPAGCVRIKAQLTVWVLERRPEIPLFSVPLRHWQRQQDPQYRCWRGRPRLLPRPSATGAQRAAHRAEFRGFWPLECPRLDAAVPLNPGLPAALLSLRLAWRSMRRSFGRLGSIPPHLLAAPAGSSLPNTGSELCWVLCRSSVRSGPGQVFHLPWINKWFF